LKERNNEDWESELAKYRVKKPSSNESANDDWEKELAKYKITRPTSALQTFGHAAVTSSPRLISNVAEKSNSLINRIVSGLTGHMMNKKDDSIGGFLKNSILKHAPEALPTNQINQALKERLLSETPEQVAGREAHPISNFLGDLVGSTPVFGGASGALRSIPAISKVIAKASPSLLKRMGIHGLEGAGLGATFSPEGQEGEGALYGGALGALLGGPAVSAVRGLPKARESLRNLANIEELGAQREQALGAHEEQKALLNDLKKQYKEQEANIQSPESITRKISNKMGEKEGLQSSAEMPEESLLTNERGAPIDEEAVNHSLNQKSESISAAKNYLGHNLDLDVEIAKGIKNSVKQAKEHIQKEYYKPVDEYAKKHNVRFVKTPTIEEVNSQLDKVINDGAFRESPEFNKLRESLIESGKKEKMVPANEFINQWKETKQAAAKARRNGYKEGGENQAYWQNTAVKLQKLADDQLKVLGNNLPKEYYDKLVRAGELWREEITPFYGNKIYEGAKKLGRIDKPNIMKEVRGSGMGQEKMQELLLSHPELARMSIGHTYAKNPEGLLSAPEHVQPFIKQLPELQQHLARMDRASRAHEIAKAHQKVNTEIIKRQAERTKAIKESNKLESDIKELERKRNQLIERLKKKDITKAEFERLDNQHKSALESKRKLYSSLKKAAYLAGLGAASKITGLL
jgi:hypothetical protein